MLLTLLEIFVVYITFYSVFLTHYLLDIFSLFSVRIGKVLSSRRR